MTTTAAYPFDLGLGIPSSSDFQLLPFSTQSEEERFWLTHGLLWYYAFNHEEAIFCFTRALEVSSACVMAHWGVSICHGPNYNTKSMSRDAFPSATAAYTHAQKVKELLSDSSIRSTLSETEGAILEALDNRYNPIDETVDSPIYQNTMLYADAMAKVYLRFPNVACVACLYAEAVMNYNPWDLWDLNTGASREHTLIVKNVLDKAIIYAPKHPGLNHFMVHLMEMSPTPQDALPCCDVLRYSFPDAGHLIHMPSHIYVLLGSYSDAAASNVEANVADAKYVAKEGIHNCYTGYRIHNMHFVSYAAMFSGDYDMALKSAEQIKENLPESVLEDKIMSMYFESFLAVEWHVFIRFGKWRQILQRSVKGSERERKLYPFSIAMQHYARGIALAVLSGSEDGDEDGDGNGNSTTSLLADAEHELSLYRLAYQQVHSPPIVYALIKV